MIFHSRPWLLSAGMACVAASVLVAQDQPAETGTGRLSAVWPLPGETEFASRMETIARRQGDDTGPYRQVVIKELQAVQDRPVDLPLLAAGEDQPVGYMKYQYYVPGDYAPGRPFGLIVFIGAGDGPGVSQEYQPILDKHHMIWIAADKSGNERPTIWRMLLALEAVQQIKSRYTIDDERVYLSGFSGGSRVASMLAVQTPDVFTGGFFFCGVNYYRDVPGDGRRYWPGFWSRPDQRLLQMAQRNSRFVIQTGSDDDSSLANSRDTHKAFEQDRFTALYMEIPGHDHANPTAEYYDQGLSFLDAPLKTRVDALYRQAQDLERRRKLGEACIAYERVSVRGSDKPYAQAAAEKAAALRLSYAEQVEQIRQPIEAGDLGKAVPANNRFKTVYGPLAERQVAVFQEQIIAARRAQRP